MGQFCQLGHVILVWVVSSFMSDSGFACRCLFGGGASRQRSTFSRWNMREICSYRHIRADTRCELVKIPSCCKETWDVMYPSSIVALRLQLEKRGKKKNHRGPMLEEPFYTYTAKDSYSKCCNRSPRRQTMHAAACCVPNNKYMRNQFPVDCIW